MVRTTLKVSDETHLFIMTSRMATTLAGDGHCSIRQAYGVRADNYYNRIMS